jgi:MscS family membrane protein
VAVALAAKDTLANFFGGISIFVDRPYKIGDYIVLAGKERGEVMEIGIRSTRIKTRDDVMISIPNSIIANSQITNESAPIPSYRVRIPIGVAYGSDIDQVEKILLDIATANANVITDDPPRVRFREFGDSSLNSGITIPFPQRDVHIRKEA